MSLNNDSKDVSIGVSLSGGGYRAAAFGLGVLLYLAKSMPVPRNILSISSVSGGSLTNAFAGYRANFKTDNPKDIEDAMASLARFLSSRGIKLELLPKLIGVGIVLGICLAFVGLVGFLYDWHLTSKLTLLEVRQTTPALSLDYLVPHYEVIGKVFYAFVIVLGLAIAFMPLWYFEILNGSYKRYITLSLFSNDEQKSRTAKLALVWPRMPRNALLLRELHRDVDHIICATDLSHGTHFFMSPNFLLSQYLGSSHPGDLRVATAVLASAAFPGAFAPVQLSISDFTFDKKNLATKAIKTITLADGGIHDNLGTPFLVSISRRQQYPLSDHSTKPDKLVVVNASSSEPVLVRLPRCQILARFKGFFREVVVMQESNTAARASALGKLFRSDFEQGKPGGGVLVSIEESPIDVCEDLAKSRVPAANARAKEALKKLNAHPMREMDWFKICRRNQEVPTTLAALGEDKVAELMFHGYVLAMVKCHIFLGYGCPGVPDLEDFKKLCRSPISTAS